VRALVTGGAGFIGSHVVDALVERGDDVWVLDNLASGRRENVNAGSRLVEADVRDAGAVASAFAESKPETCFHLAAQADVRVSIAEPAFDAEVNVIGTANVLEAARANEAKVVFSSTGGAIYGECDGPADENSPRLPLATGQPCRKARDGRTPARSQVVINRALRSPPVSARRRDRLEAPPRAPARSGCSRCGRHR